MLRLNRKRNTGYKILLVLGLTAATFLAKSALERVLGEGPPLLLFIPSVMVCGFLGGFWTGAAATLLAVLCSSFFFMPPDLSFLVLNQNDQFRLVVFAVVSLWVSYLFETVHRHELQLVLLNKTKDRFIATLGHELRVPVNRLNLLCFEALSSPDLPATMRPVFETILENNEIERVLISDVLDIATIESGKLVCHKEVVNLQVVAEQAAQMVQPDAEAANIRIQSALPAEPIWIHADRVRIKQVLWNLLRNAIKFSPSGGTVHLEILRESPSEVLIRVTDTGLGISPANLESIFEPYRQLEEGRSHGVGLGLGLAISKTIVEMHDGKIWAQSDPLNPGARLIIRVPCLGAAPERTATSASPVSRILVVEDDPSTRLLTQRLLQRRGFEVFGAAGLSDAKLVAGKIDLVLSDLNLSDGNGWEVLSHFKSTNPQTRVVAVSGSSMDATTSAGIPYAFDQVLTKPISPQQLIGLL